MSPPLTVLIDARCLIDEKQAHAGETAVRGFIAREADDARAIGQQERDLIAAISAAPDAEARQERSGFTDQLTGLPFSRAHDEDEAFGLMPGGEDGLSGGEGGLAPLAGTVQDDLLGSGREDEGLLGVGLKVQALAGEGDRVERVADVKKRGHRDP